MTKERIGILGGLGLYEPDFLDRYEAVEIETPYGKPQYLFLGSLGEKEVVFTPRWFRDGEFIPVTALYQTQKAYIWAYHKLGVKQIFSTDGVGSINPLMKLGDFALVTDFIDFTGRNDHSYNGKIGDKCMNMPFNEPYCQRLSNLVLQAADDAEVPMHRHCVMAITEGPRFETPAEIRFYRLLGCDGVSQGMLPEMVLARELGMCYSSVYTVSNYGADLGEWVVEDLVEIEAGITKKVQALVKALIKRIPLGTECICARYPEEHVFKVETLRKHGFLKKGTV